MYLLIYWYCLYGKQSICKAWPQVSRRHLLGNSAWKKGEILVGWVWTCGGSCYSSHSRGDAKLDSGRHGYNGSVMKMGCFCPPYSITIGDGIG